MNFRFHLRSNRLNKKGLAALYFIIEDTRPVWVPTHLYLLPKHWNQDDQLLTKDAHSAAQRSFTELQYKATIYKQSIDFHQKPFTVRDFKMAVFGDGITQLDNPTFSYLIDEYKKHKDLSFEREKHYSAMNDEMKVLYPGLRISDITFQFASKLYKYFSSTYTHNTATRKMKQLKAIVHFAVDIHALKEDPLQQLKLKAFTSKKTFLTIPELQQLQELYDSAALNKYQQNVLRHFLFSCYTGLRVSDIAKFNATMVTGDCIYLTQTKTKTEVIIPLTDQSKSLMQKPFDIHAGQYLNRELAEIMKHAGITKHVTMHVGRHTFATSSLRLGIQLKVVSEVLGHSSVKQTEEYLHLVEDHLKDEMSKWKNLSVAYKAATG